MSNGNGNGISIKSLAQVLVVAALLAGGGLVWGAVQEVGKIKIELAIVQQKLNTQSESMMEVKGQLNEVERLLRREVNK